MVSVELRKEGHRMGSIRPVWLPYGPYECLSRKKWERNRGFVGFPYDPYGFPYDPYGMMFDLKVKRRLVGFPYDPYGFPYDPYDLGNGI
jgi:hypothetical protein